MKVRSVGHKYLGPKADLFVATRAVRFRGVCSCHWIGSSRATRRQAREDWKVHQVRSAAKVAEEAAYDRDAGVDW